MKKTVKTLVPASSLTTAHVGRDVYVETADLRVHGYLSQVSHSRYQHQDVAITTVYVYTDDGGSASLKLTETNFVVFTDEVDVEDEEETDGE